MSRPYDVADERFDEAGFEVPFATVLEGEALNEADATFGAESESPFAESTFEAEAVVGEGFDLESLDAAAPHAEAEQQGYDEALAWLDVEALTDTAAAEAEEQGAGAAEGEGQDEAEAESAAASGSMAEAESYESMWQGEAETALSEGEWNEAQVETEAEVETEEEAAEREAQEGEDFVGRFDAFEDERDAEWEIDEDEAFVENERLLAGSGLSTAEQKAVEITSLFETGKRGGFYGLAGNFDGHGLSFGLVNWNIGTGSLQPLLRAFAREQPARWAQVFGPHAPAFLMVITPAGKAAKKVQLKFAVEQMNTSTLVKGRHEWSIKEPWVTYFKRLSQDREFQQIQLRYVRDLLRRADYFCRYFKLNSEMAFAYMFDAVSTHGKWWLTKQFKGREKRRLEIEKKLVTLTAQHGEGRVPEADILLAIADVLSATSAQRWAARVRRRKRWFVTGDHPRAKELQGLEPAPDVPYRTSAAREAEMLEVLRADSIAEESEDPVHRWRRPLDSRAGGTSAAPLDPGNFRQFVDANRLDLEIAHVLNVLDHYPEGSWAKHSASFAHHELVANNLLAVVKGSNSRRAADQIPAALRATEVPRVELNANALGATLRAVTVADIGAPNTFSGYILVEDDLVRNGTQPGEGRKKLALTLAHELSHIRNRVESKKDIPAMRRDLDTFVRPGDADAALGAAEFFEEMVAKHIEWRVLKDIEHKWEGKPIPARPRARGLFQFALLMPSSGSDMFSARTNYLARLVTDGNPFDYNRQIGLWLRLIANRALFHDSPTINDTVRQQFLDEFNLVQPDFRTPGVNPDGGVFFDKPTSGENESEEARVAAESEIAADARVILGKWTVRLKDWVWEYEFSPGGKVTWRDTRSNEKGAGRWTVSPKAINITWANSTTTESWARPLMPARQRGWYKSTYYTGGYQPQKVGTASRGSSTLVPAWADAIDPFPGSVTVGLDRSNASMTTAFAPVTVSTANHLCAALADVTGAGASAPFAALRENEMLYVGSLLKVGVMYAAFALRARVQAFADAAKANGVNTAGELFPLIKRAWTPKLKALFPARATRSFGNNQDVTVPQVDRIFTLSSTGKIAFATASPAITVADLDRAGEFGAPIGLFHEWLRLMMRWSNNTAASRCVLALGYFYINGLFARSGFFSAGKGLWISGDYAGHDWVKTTAERSANAAGVALEPRWATAQRRTKSNFVGNALQVGRLMAAMAQGKLVDAGSSDEMRKLADQLSGGIGSYARSALTAVGRTPTALSSKIGFGDDSFSHDCAIVARTVGGKRLRYAAVVLGSAPAQGRRDLSDLFVLLDAVVVARNP